MGKSLTSDDDESYRAAPALALMHYAIRIRGMLGESLLAAFPELTARRVGTDTLLYGHLPDQAALHGVLSQIEALALDLLEVRRVPAVRHEASI